MLAFKINSQIARRRQVCHYIIVTLETVIMKEIVLGKLQEIPLELKHESISFR